MLSPWFLWYLWRCHMRWRLKAWLVQGGAEGGELENVQTFSKIGSPPLPSLQITQLRHHHHHVPSTPWWLDVGVVGLFFPKRFVLSTMKTISSRLFFLVFNHKQLVQLKKKCFESCFVDLCQKQPHPIFIICYKLSVGKLLSVFQTYFTVHYCCCN